MSRPPSFLPPPRARVCRLSTARGEFAVVDAPAVGATRGTVLLLPGYTGSKEDFGPLHEPLNAAGYRTVAVDGRGQHESDGPRDDESAYAQGELARDVLAQATVLGAGRVHLLGHSLGGQIARAAVLLDAAPFCSLTLMSSGPAEISASQQERVRLLGSVLTQLDMAQVWEAIQALEPPDDTVTDTAAGVEEGVLAPGAGQDADPDRLRRRWLRNSPAQLLATGRQLCAEPDRVEELARVPLPVHVISGAVDHTWPVPLLDEMAKRLGAHRTVVQGAEHSPNTDRPQLTAAALAAFWNTVDPAAPVADVDAVPRG